MDILQAIILGIVEGITEFLPVSSTGHLILTSHLLGYAQSDFLKSFEIVIQLGAILSVVVLYARTLLRSAAVWARVAIAFLPTAVVGLLLYTVIKNVFFENIPMVLWSLFWGGLILVLFDAYHKESASSIDDVAKIPYRIAFIIGLFQSLSVIPGISRSAATIIGGLAFGIKRKTIVELSFLLAVPTMLAATGFDLWRSAPAFSTDQFALMAAGFITSFIVACISIKFLIHFIQHHNFIVFGIYRMLLPVIWFITEKI